MGLFGSSKKTRKTSSAPIEATGVMIMKLKDNLATQEKREANLMTRIDNVVQEAKAKNKRGDKRGALFALKKKKMYEQELAKIENVKMTLETQIMNLEGAAHNVESVNAMKSGTGAMKSIRKALGIDRVDAVLDDVREEMEMHREIDDALMQPLDSCLVDEDELMAELYALEAKDTVWPVTPSSRPVKKPTKQLVQTAKPKSTFALFG